VALVLYDKYRAQGHRGPRAELPDLAIRQEPE